LRRIDADRYDTIPRSNHPIWRRNMSTHLQNRPEVAVGTTDTDLLLRLGIVLALKRRAGWHLVRFAVQHGVVELAGVVPTMYDRQLISAMARHVAGVLRVVDALTVGDAAIRQQLTDKDAVKVEDSSAPDSSAQRNPFAHLPVVPESLEEILARQTAAARDAA
jgi:hypothetical protein